MSKTIQRTINPQAGSTGEMIRGQVMNYSIPEEGEIFRFTDPANSRGGTERHPHYKLGIVKDGQILTFDTDDTRGAGYTQIREDDRRNAMIADFMSESGISGDVNSFYNKLPTFVEEEIEEGITQGAFTLGGSLNSSEFGSEYNSGNIGTRSIGYIGDPDNESSRFGNGINAVTPQQEQEMSNTAGNAQTNDINNLYNQFFGRDASQPEIDNWSKERLIDLESFLNREYKNLSGGKDYDGTPYTGPDESGTTGEVDTGIDLDKPDGYNNWSTEFQSMWDLMSESLDTLVQQGQMVNPNIEITEEQQAEWLDGDTFLGRATKELEPYFNEQIQSLKEDLEYSVGETKRLFKEEKGKLGESLAETGFGISGHRGSKERELGAAAQRSMRRIGRAAEGELGSESLEGLDFGSVGVTNINEQEEQTSLYSLSGNMTGRLQKEKDTAISTRQSELERLFRGERALNFA